MNQSIYVFDKNTPNSIAKTTRSIDSLLGTSFAQNSVYHLTLGNPHYMSRLKDEYSLLFDLIKDCYIVYKDTQIVTLDDFCCNFSAFFEWDVSHNGKRWRKKRIYESFKKKWSDNAKNIENYLSSKYEGKWNDFLEYTNNKIMKRSWQVKDDHKEFILKYMAIQVCRIFRNTQRIGIDKMLREFCDIFQADNDVRRELMKSDYRDDLSLSLLYTIYRHERYQDEKAKGMHQNATPADDERFDTNLLSAMYSTWEKNTIVFLRSSTVNFITSDNPVISAHDITLKGVYFPITPKLCILMIHNRNCDNKHKIVDISDQNVRFINYLVKREARSSLAYSKDSLSDLLCKKCDIDSFKTSFIAAGLELC